MNLIEGLQEEINRCRELLTEYQSIGTAGMFGAAFIKQEIQKAEYSISMGNTIGMLTCLKELKECN